MDNHSNMKRGDEYGVVGRYREADHRAMNEFVDGRFAVALWFSLTGNTGANGSSPIFSEPLIAINRQSQGTVRSLTAAGTIQCERHTGTVCEARSYE